MRTISVSNNKGGSAKTTTAVSLASACGERGLRVLVVDLDPQGSATDWLGGTGARVGLVEFSEGGFRIADLVVDSTAPRVQLIPTSTRLSPPGGRERVEAGLAIVRGFARLPDYWDLIVIDTPPTLDYLSLAALVASDVVVIPFEAHALAVPGVTSVIASIQRVRLQVNRRLELLGIVACRVTSARHAREVVDLLRSKFGELVLEQSVRESIQIAEAPALQLPITTYAPNSPVANDYRAVTAELLERLGDLGSR